MAFSTKRGRPKSTQNDGQDSGTPELQQKRRHHGTMEPLDRLLSAQQITSMEHRAGIHFRWLYTLCHGVPLPARRTLADNAGGIARQDAPFWREERELEYREAAQALQSSGRIGSVLNYCLFEEWPRDGLEIKMLREGLNVLVTLWRLP